jgi:hypothetical protein
MISWLGVVVRLLVRIQSPQLEEGARDRLARRPPPGSSTSRPVLQPQGPVRDCRLLGVGRVLTGRGVSWRKKGTDATTRAEERMFNLRED